MDGLSNLFNGMNGTFFALMGAATAALAGLGSAEGVGLAGSAGSGASAEEPKNFGLTLILQALPGTQGIYGLLMAFLIMNKIGFLGGSGPIDITVAQGLYIFASAIPVGIVGLCSAISQGKTAASAIMLVSKRPEEIAKGVVYTAMVETYAVLALLTSFLMFNAIKL